MGMFDHVLVQYPLEDHEHLKIQYQTKDLENSLSRYLIDPQGYLWVERGKYEQEEGGMFGFQLRLISTHVEQVPFHGDLEIYGSVTRDSPTIDYMIRFVDGKVTRAALCKSYSEHGWPVWNEPPFPDIEPRPTKLVPPVFPPVGGD